jgi:hypothetical protein
VMQNIFCRIYKFRKKPERAKKRRQERGKVRDRRVAKNINSRTG